MSLFYIKLNNAIDTFNGENIPKMAKYLVNSLNSEGLDSVSRKNYDVYIPNVEYIVSGKYSKLLFYMFSFL